MRSDTTGHFGLIAGIIAAGAVVGGLLGAFTAATTGGNVLENAIEGCITGAIGAACGILIGGPWGVLVAAGGGFLADIGVQAAAQYITPGKVDGIDPVRAIKTGLLTGIGAAIPEFGQGGKNAIDAFGTALTWAEGSTLIACADVAVTNTVDAIQSKPGRTRQKPALVAIHEQQRLYM